MALSNERLGNNWADTILSFLGGNSPIAQDEETLRNFMKALAQDVITEFKENAVIESTGTTGPTASVGQQTPIPALPGVIKE